MNTEAKAILGRRERGFETPPRSWNSQGLQLQWKGGCGEQVGNNLVKLKIGVSYTQNSVPYICALGIGTGRSVVTLFITKN